MGCLARLRFPAPVTAETWICDGGGDPVLVVMSTPGASLAGELRRLVVEQGVITGQFDHTGGAEAANQVGRQGPPHLVHGPGAVADEAVVGVVRASSERVGHRDHVGAGAPARGRHPSGEQVG